MAAIVVEISGQPEKPEAEALCRRPQITPEGAGSLSSDFTEAEARRLTGVFYRGELPLRVIRKLASPVSASKAVEGWPAFVAFLENHNPILWAKVSHCTVKASGELLELEVPDMFENSANGPEFVRNTRGCLPGFLWFPASMEYNKEIIPDFPGAAAQGRKTGKPSGQNTSSIIRPFSRQSRYWGLNSSR